MTFKSYPSGATVEIRDNGAGDHSSHPGVITAAVKPGATYEACFKDARFYMNDNRDPVTYPQCAKVTTSSMTPNIGTIFGRRYPKFTFLSKDIYGNMVVRGGTLQISMFGWTGIIADRDLGFGGSLDGTIVFETKLPPTATTWCEYSPPLKYQLVSVKCGSIMTELDKHYTITWVHQKLLY